MTNFENDLAQTKVPQGPYIKVCHGSAASHSDSPILNLTGTLIKGSPPTRAELASKCAKKMDLKEIQ